jgi:AcrR family transcriptional regulator
MTRAHRSLPERTGRARGIRSDAFETRRRLLETGRELFAEHGFEKVTVRDIAHGAQANLAAISYHFRDKLGLYMEVVREGLGMARAFNEEIMGALPDASPEERLRHYVHSFLPRVIHSDRKAWIHQILRHEMANPTPAAAGIVEETIMPRVRYLAEIVRELLHGRATDLRTRRCVTSIQAQCLFYAPDPFKKAAFGDWQPRTEAAIRETADHIVEFSIAGIRAVAGRPA